MKLLKRIILSVVYIIVSRAAIAQNYVAREHTMYVKNSAIYDDTQNRDTLYATIGDIWGERALILRQKNGENFDILSLCCNRSTPHRVKFIYTGNNLFRIGNRIIVKMDNKTINDFFDRLDRFDRYLWHCDHMSHMSHGSHYSHYSSAPINK